MSLRPRDRRLLGRARSRLRAASGQLDAIAGHDDDRETELRALAARAELAEADRALAGLRRRAFERRAEGLA